MAGLRIYSQLIVRYSALVSVDGTQNTVMFPMPQGKKKKFYYPLTLKYLML